MYTTEGDGGGCQRPTAACSIINLSSSKVAAMAARSPQSRPSGRLCCRCALPVGDKALPVHWAGLGWAGLGWAGLGWAGLICRL